MLSASAQQVKNMSPVFLSSLSDIWQALLQFLFVHLITSQRAPVHRMNILLQSPEVTKCARECAEDNCSGQFQRTIDGSAQVMQVNEI